MKNSKQSRDRKQNGGGHGLREVGEGHNPLFNEQRVSVWEDEKVLEVDGSDDHKTIQIYMSMNCILLKDGLNGKFVIYI